MMLKKSLILSLIIVCACTTIKAQDVVNLRMDRQQMGLRGYVASMDEDILLRKDYFREDWPERKWFIKDLRNVLREDEGRIVTFNPAGRMLTITYTHQGKMGLKTACVYAPNGLLSSFVGEGYKVEAKYNGNLADINVYAETKDYRTTDLAKADLNTTPYANTYPFDLKCRQELSDDGLVMKSSYFYVDSTMARDCEYSYNHNNLLIGERSVSYSDGEKSVSFTKYVYDNRNFLVKKTIHSKDLDETYTYENNDLGDCTKMTVERPYGTSVYTFEYVYDSMGNWTVRLQFLDGVFDNAVLRTFTYHKAPAEPSAKQQKGKKSDNAAVEKKSSKKSDTVEPKSSKKNAETDADKQAEKERIAAEKQAAKEAKARQQEEMKAQKARAKEAEKNMTKEERKAAAEQHKAIEKAAKERAAAEKRAEKERIAAEKQAEKDRIAAEKQVEKERKAAEKAAKKNK